METRRLQPRYYHWLERPQASFLSRRKFCRDKHVCIATTNPAAPILSPPLGRRVCRAQNRPSPRLSLRQNYACRNKTFVATKLCLSRQNIFVATNGCRDKYVFVATSIFLSRQKTCCIATNTCLLRLKKNVCRGKDDTCGSSYQ